MGKKNIFPGSNYVQQGTLELGRASNPALLRGRSHRRGDSWINLFTVFLATSAIGIILSLSFLYLKSKYGIRLDIVDDDTAREIVLQGLNPGDKNSFLASKSREEQRALARHVHYLAELIRSTRIPAKEAINLSYAIVNQSNRLDFDPIFVAAVIKAESTFNARARSPVGALGLMQIMPNTGKHVSKISSATWHGEGRLKDPNYNIQLGIEYLKYLRKKYRGNMELALIAYNWGPGKLNDALKYKKHIPKSTVKYARTIINNHSKWRRDLEARGAEFQYFGVGRS